VLLTWAAEIGERRGGRNGGEGGEERSEADAHVANCPGVLTLTAFVQGAQATHVPERVAPGASGATARTPRVTGKAQMRKAQIRTMIFGSATWLSDRGPSRYDGVVIVSVPKI
jgi:hypothetical protein